MRLQIGKTRRAKEKKVFGTSIITRDIYNPWVFKLRFLDETTEEQYAQLILTVAEAAEIGTALVEFAERHKDDE